MRYEMLSSSPMTRSLVFIALADDNTWKSFRTLAKARKLHRPDAIRLLANNVKDAANAFNAMRPLRKAKLDDRQDATLELLNLFTVAKEKGQSFADRFALSLEQCGNPIREQDEYYCPKCGRRWEVDEPKPNC